jgi:hypothetical protein
MRQTQPLHRLLPECFLATVAHSSVPAAVALLLAPLAAHSSAVVPLRSALALPVQLQAHRASSRQLQVHWCWVLSPRWRRLSLAPLAYLSFQALRSEVPRHCL